MLKSFALGMCHSALLLAAASAARSVTWTELPRPVQVRLQSAVPAPASFPQFLERLNEVHRQRVREGDLDHLVFYALQSSHFTRLPPIEPAVSARALVDAVPASSRGDFLDRGELDLSLVPAAVRARTRDLLRAVDGRDPDPRLGYFRQLVSSVFPPGGAREPALLREYLRAMRFLYKKEFVAQRAANAADAVATLYRSRGLSTDTAVEAGYVVHLG